MHKDKTTLLIILMAVLMVMVGVLLLSASIMLFTANDDTVRAAPPDRETPALVQCEDGLFRATCE